MARKQQAEQWVEHRRRARGHERVWLQGDEFSRIGLQAIRVGGCEASFDADVAALGPSKLP